MRGYHWWIRRKCPSESGSTGGISGEDRPSGGGHDDGSTTTKPRDFATAKSVFAEAMVGIAQSGAIGLSVLRAEDFLGLFICPAEVVEKETLRVPH